MPKKDLAAQNSKEASYYGLIMVVSFLAWYIIDRVMQTKSDLPDFLIGFSVVLCLLSSIITIIKYVKSRKEPRTTQRNKATIFAILACIFWVLVLFKIFKTVLP
ncbi:hypothetical protein [Dokdonia sp. Hel_I_53]|uniref:hypothetical protein n=1 Tax=Dokdonia sp. Hel_I_53 TaxID=1566287 RepID=UPI00119A118B|nr:hypothetical protein [Dokdonia sp. Hel_I_53]TVZ52745.1 hypothetical protein OD90_1929 [Dokdonia sp. Hel_I_53]